MSRVAPGVRIGGGALRGRRLKVPPGIRPSEGKVKEALFSIWGDRLDGARFLDLFAGSGAVGIEAVSRGALEVTVVERDPRVASALRANLALLSAGAASLVRLDVDSAITALLASGNRFDLIFADPPYAVVPDTERLAKLSALLTEGGRVAWEHASRVTAPIEAGRLVRLETRRYGEAALSFYGAD